MPTGRKECRQKARRCLVDSSQLFVAFIESVNPQLSKKVAGKLVCDEMYPVSRSLEKVNTVAVTVLSLPLCPTTFVLPHRIFNRVCRSLPAQLRKEQFRSLLNQPAMNCQSRFCLTETTYDNIMGAIRGLCRADSPLSCAHAEHLLPLWNKQTVYPANFLAG